MKLGVGPNCVACRRWHRVGIVARRRSARYPIPPLTPQSRTTARTRSVLQSVKKAFYAHQPGAAQTVITAIAEFAAARRRRDALFLRALLKDGTIPMVVITKFRMGRVEINRLIPVLDRPLPPAV
ncbi:hypothetical protein, partial [Nocardia salmonicida]|uniref:hypothetical protein n=1 Tax=Nocardia salmonicida TaxID=53431 RepID=UPI0033DAE7DC